MRHYIWSAVVLSVIAFPALARDGAPYTGVEGGALFPRSTNYDVFASRVQSVPTGNGLLGQTVTTTNTRYGNGVHAKYKTGFDVDAIAGYDFGFVRVEGEVGYKRANVSKLAASSFLLTDTNTAPISGITSGSFAFGRRTSALSGMFNALADYDATPQIRVYAGGGAGRARVKSLGDHDDAWAYQLIAGAATSVGPNVELGLKYRYFQTQRVRFDSTASFADAASGATSVSQLSERGRFRSNSVLVSLTYNFGGGGAQ